MSLFSIEPTLDRPFDMNLNSQLDKVYSKTAVSLILMLIFITASFKPFMSASFGHNLLFLVYSLIFIYINRYELTHLYKEHIGLYLFLLFFVISSFFHFSTFRISSFFYTLFYILLFHLFISVIRSGTLSIYNYVKVIRGLLLAFFVVLVIQQIMHLFGIRPVFNQMGSIGWKLNSLSLEPSLTGTIVNILFYSYIKIKEFIYEKEIKIKMLFKEDFWVVFSYLYVIFTCGSSYGVLFFLIVSLHFLKLRPLSIIIISLSCVLLCWLLYALNFVPFVRIVNIVKAITTFDTSAIISAEASAGFRVVPVFQFFYNFSFTDINTWLGRGMTYSAVQFANFLDVDETMVYGWCFPNFAIDQGLICFALLIYFIAKNALFAFYKVETLIFVLALLNTSLNTTCFWVIVMYFTLNKFFITNFKHTPLVE